MLPLTVNARLRKTTWLFSYFEKYKHTEAYISHLLNEQFSVKTSPKTSWRNLSILSKYVNKIGCDIVGAGSPSGCAGIYYIIHILWQALCWCYSCQIVSYNFFKGDNKVLETYKRNPCSNFRIDTSTALHILQLRKILAFCSHVRGL